MPSMMCRSVRQSPAPPIRTITSSASWTFGSGTSTSLRNSGPCTAGSYLCSRAAFIPPPPDGVSWDGRSRQGTPASLVSRPVSGLEQAAAERRVELHRETGALRAREVGPELGQVDGPAVGVYEGRRSDLTGQSSLLQDGQIAVGQGRSLAAEGQARQVADPQLQNCILHPPQREQRPDQTLLSRHESLDPKGRAQFVQIVRRQRGKRFHEGLAAIDAAADLLVEEVVLQLNVYPFHPRQLGHPFADVGGHQEGEVGGTPERGQAEADGHHATIDGHPADESQFR